MREALTPGAVSQSSKVRVIGRRKRVMPTAYRITLSYPDSAFVTWAEVRSVHEAPDEEQHAGEPERDDKRQPDR